MTSRLDTFGGSVTMSLNFTLCGRSRKIILVTEYPSNRTKSQYKFGEVESLSLSCNWVGSWNTAHSPTFFRSCSLSLTTPSFLTFSLTTSLSFGTVPERRIAGLGFPWKFLVSAAFRGIGFSPETSFKATALGAKCCQKCGCVMW